MSKRDEAIAAISRAILGRTATVAAPAALDAVIAVLMEPDQAMLDGGARQVDVTNPHHEDVAQNVWTSMIDAALGGDQIAR